jgi:hypothetical protein
MTIVQTETAYTFRWLGCAGKWRGDSRCLQCERRSSCPGLANLNPARGKVRKRPLPPLGAGGSYSSNC